MVAHSTKVQHLKGYDFQGNPVEELITSPDQLTLFQSNITNGYSSTIELYDAMPAYYASSKEMEAIRQKNSGRFLDTLNYDFTHRGKGYSLTVNPARINKNGQEREYYPSKSGALIEKALRKLSTNPQHGIYLSGEFAVGFRFGELRRELESHGHSMSYQSIMDGLKINNATHTVLDPKDGSDVIRSTLFPVFIHANREQWRKNPEHAKCYVKFHPLVTQSIEGQTYRQSNYAMMMKLRRMLSYWLFDRMSHLYKQAALLEPYTISLNTLVHDSYMEESMYPSENLKTARRTIVELQKVGAIFDCEETIKRGLNNRILDVMFTLYPSPHFVQHAIEANIQHKQLKKLTAS